jgi:CubicO group peptidase (beta-lactamase class C family)
MKKLLPYLFCFIFLSCNTTDFEPDLSKDFSMTLREIKDFYNLPSIACAIIEDGNVIYEFAEGETVQGSSIDVSVNSPYHINSNGKAFTSVLASLCVDSGEIKWESTVSEILGHRFTNISNEYGSITLRQLLNNTSGVPNTPKARMWNRSWDIPNEEDQRNQIVEDMMTLSLRFTSGEKFEYSNYAFVIAGVMLEEVTGKQWEVLLQERLFSPLEMNHSGFGPPALINKPSDKSIPWGHNNKGPIDPLNSTANYLPGIGPAGNIYSTLSDLYNFINLYFNEGKTPNGETILSSQYFQMLRESNQFNYELGWYSYYDEEDKSQILAHSGGDESFNSQIYILQDRESAIIILTNSGTMKAEKAVYVACNTAIRKYFLSD